MFRRGFILLGFALLIALGMLVSNSEWSAPSASGATVPPVPAVHDNFADAMEISVLPTNQQVDIRLATLESGELAPTCGYGALDNTVWYRYTPTEDNSVTVSAQTYDYWDGVVGVYVGGSMSTLSNIDCRQYDRWSSSNLTSFQASAGTTYYIQMGGLSGGTGTVGFSLREADPPMVNGLNISPYQPSIYNQVRFSGYGSDPVGIYGFSYRWVINEQEYIEQYPSVDFDADGEYTAMLEMTTQDGRSAQKEETFSVETHDVILANFRGPSVGRKGHTASIRVGVHNDQYPDNTTVILYRSTPSGFTEVGRLTQFVDVHERRAEITDFHFSYTFTEQDEEIGRMTFKAEAILTDSRESLPADNAYSTWPVYIKPSSTPVHGSFDFEYQEYVRDENEVLIPSVYR